MSAERIKLSVDEAIACLPEGDEIHTLYARGFLCGASWAREEVIEYIKHQGGASISGPVMRGMKHGICLNQQERLFCEHDEDVLAKIEATPVGGAK